MKDRYNRNILIEGFGAEGQARLKASKALVIGAGGLGSPVLLYLAAAGVGTIGIVDDDVVSITNLQRQILHFTDDLGRLKTDSAKQKLNALNPDVKVVRYNCRFSEANAEAIVKGYKSIAGLSMDTTCNNPYSDSVNLDNGSASPDGEYDFVLSCCDNYATKLLINDICVQLKKPYSHGAAASMRGEVMTCIPGTACYRCVFDTLPEDGTLPTSSQTGILGSVAGIIGNIQATEAIKYLVGMNDLLTNRLLIADAKTMNFVSLKVKKRSSCFCTESFSKKTSSCQNGRLI
jgi:molybdopterin/thiamine biosynthesis adenylyltransferase